MKIIILVYKNEDLVDDMVDYDTCYSHSERGCDVAE